MGPFSSLILEQAGGDQMLTFRGMIPAIDNGGFRSDVELRLDDKTLVRQSAGTGEVRISVGVPESAGKHRITIFFSGTQELPAGDGRSVGAKLLSVGFGAPGLAAATPVGDIVQGDEVQLLSGWGVLETFGHETFRWVENDADLRLSPVSSAAVEFSATLEAGPGLGTNSFELKVFDPFDKQIATGHVQGRTTVKLSLPVDSGRPAKFRLHVDGGGKPAPNDPRILNFRVFQITVKASVVPLK